MKGETTTSWPPPPPHSRHAHHNDQAPSRITHQMTSLVSNFIIRPVLRQARRFSRSSSSAEETAGTPHHVLPITELEAEGNEKEMQEQIPIDSSGGGLLSNQPIVESPLASPSEEDEPYSVAWNRSNTEPAAHTSSRVPLRVASLRSVLTRTDNDISENPSFGTPSDFQTSSPSSISTSVSTMDIRVDLAGGDTRSVDDGSSDTRQRDRSLPENDGMGELRRRIVAVQGMDVSPEEKARMMHHILTEGYSRGKTNVPPRPIPRAPSPASTASQDPPTTPGSPSSFGLWPLSMTPNSSPPRPSSFKLSHEDLRPTYAPPKPRRSDDEEAVNLEHEENDNDEESSEPVLGCPHYRRNVKLQCSQCHGWYTCRFCHDEVESHALIRKETKNMLCMLCGFPQPAGQTCVQCGEQAAWYYCSICKLWDNDASKSIYHCDDCGICRIGRGLGKDFIHCKTCGVCMSIAIENSHKCIERSTDCDCPICGEYMFSSPQTVVFMRCGHSIHHKCYYEHMQTSYKCPICSKSIVNMETQFRNLDRAIDNQPMPPKFQDTKAMVHCNDCYARSAVKYHWLGLKCAICDSYNTAQLQILSDPEVPDPGTESGQPDGQVPDPEASPPSTNQFLAPSAPQRVRRHSNINPTPIAPRFAPYPIPQRMARSVSPSRATFGELSSLHETGTPGPSGTNSPPDSENEDDELDFWGYNRHSSRISEHELEEEDDEEYEDDSASDVRDCEEDDDDDDDDGDEEDGMELFGHR